MKSKNILDQKKELQIYNTSIAIIILTEEAFKQWLHSTKINKKKHMNLKDTSQYKLWK